MNYYDYLGQFVYFSKEPPTLDVISWFLKKVGNPHLGMKFVHVAGTNGKGSVVETIASALQRAGLKVGKHISPYLVRFNEYISINGVEITDNEAEEYLDELKPFIDERLTAGLPVRYFEIVGPMAFMHFKRHNVDIAVIEVGMGGTHDYTNVITPLVSIITKIDFDHKEVLGQTIEEIAGKKAGIIKRDVPSITSNEDEALEVIRRKAKEENSTLTEVKKSEISKVELQIEKPKMTFRFKHHLYETTLLGRHQATNTALAIEALKILQPHLPKHPTLQHQKIFRVTHPARFEVLSREPLIIFDGAHNANGIQGLCDLVRDAFTGKKQKKLFIVSMLKRKDPDEAMEQLALGKGHRSSIIFTSGTCDEFHSAKTLLTSFMKFINPKNQTSIKLMNFHDALNQANPDVATFIIGSFKTYKTVQATLGKH